MSCILLSPITESVMPPKSSKVLVSESRELRPAPIATAKLNKSTLTALGQSAKRLNDVPARAFSKSDIEQFFKNI